MVSDDVRSSLCVSEVREELERKSQTKCDRLSRPSATPASSSGCPCKVLLLLSANLRAKECTSCKIFREMKRDGQEERKEGKLGQTKFGLEARLASLGCLYSQSAILSILPSLAPLEPFKGKGGKKTAKSKNPLQQQLGMSIWPNMKDNTKGDKVLSISCLISLSRFAKQLYF